MARTNRPHVSVIAWVVNDGRPRELAAALDGEARTFFDLGIVRRPLVPLRYALSSVRTALYLLARRPRALIVQTPPMPLVVIAYLYGRLTSAPIVIDSHPAAFGLDGSSVDRRLLPLLGRIAGRVSGCIVTTPNLGERVSRWGGRPLVVHEGPPEWLAEDAAVQPEPKRVLFVSTFAPDEPLGAVLEAARRLPDVRFGVTGDPRKLREEHKRAAPPNVEWLGYLTGTRYPEALRRAEVVVTLTGRRESVPRSAYEAVYAERPLVITDWPHMHDLFPHAMHVQNRSDSIAQGVRHALDSAQELGALAGEAHRLQQERWRRQVEELRSAVGFQPASVGTDSQGEALAMLDTNGGFTQ